MKRDLLTMAGLSLAVLLLEFVRAAYGVEKGVIKSELPSASPSTSGDVKGDIKGDVKTDAPAASPRPDDQKAGPLRKAPEPQQK